MQDFESLASAIHDKIEKARTELAAEKDQLAFAREKLDKEKEDLSKKYPVEETIIHLNVGGKHFSTYKTTLTRVEGTMLEALFSGRHPIARDEKDRCFIDRSPKHFDTVLNFLRTGIMVTPRSPEQKEELKLELEYYGIRLPSSAITFSWKRDSAVELSNNDRTVKKVGVNSWNCKAVGDLELSRGKVSWVVKIDTINADRTGMIIGVAPPAHPVTDFSGIIGVGMSGTTYHCTLREPVFLHAHRITIEVDFEARTVKFKRDEDCVIAEGILTWAVVTPVVFLYYTQDQVTSDP